MSIDASHIRFALDLKEDLNIKNLNKYLAGSVYPDSRHITKIDRNLTHNNDLIDDYFVGDNDFRKGWIAHLMVDNVQHEHMFKDFPDLPEKFTEEWWIHITAIKVVADMDDFSKIEMEEDLTFEGFEISNGERERSLKSYYTLIKGVFNDHEKLSFKEEYYKLMSLDVAGDLSDKLIYQAKKYSEDEKSLKKIYELYAKTLAGVRKEIKKVFK